MKLLVVDDHPIVREGIRRLLSTFLDVGIIEADCGRDAVTIFRAERPELVLLDINLPGLGGLDVLRRLLIEDQEARVLMLSMHANALYVARALEAGARGYVSKGATADQLIEAVRVVASGGRYLDPDIASEVALNYISGGVNAKELSARELDILRLLAQGKGLAAISQELGISYKTAANACTDLKQKMMVQSTSELVKLAVEMHRA